MKELLRYRLVYIASPYTKYDGGGPEGRKKAFKAACQLGAALAEAKIKFFSPIAHSHSISEEGGVDATDHELWMLLDRPLMDVSDALCVAMFSGWQISEGIAEEIKIFLDSGKPIYYLNPFTMVMENGRS